MQNDINGFPWGLLPKLREHGIDSVWMGCNSDTSVPLTTAPDAWWWEGPDGKRMLTWSGTHYCFGFELFHASEWRPRAGAVGQRRLVQPALARRNVEDFHRAPRCLRADSPREAHQDGALQVPGHRFPSDEPLRAMDNDPPSRQLADFVKAWNNARCQPKLIMSTPKPISRAAAGDVRKRDHDGSPRRLARLVERRHLHRAGAARCQSAGEADTGRLALCGASSRRRS